MAHAEFERVAGALVGCALGDALGLPFEGASRDRVVRRVGSTLDHQFLFGRGVGSDDTEHSRLVLMALARDPSAGVEFERELARGLRWWLVGLPPGIGFATLRACARLFVGFDSSRSGVFSAGNGPAMRAAVLGAYCADPAWLERAVRTTTRITHTDPKAEEGALVVARLATAPEVTPDAVHAALAGMNTEVADTLRSVVRRVRAGESPEAICGPRGPTGYVVSTLEAAVAVLLLERTFEGAITRTVRLGGDTDTVAAIVGGVLGAQLGRSALPTGWVAGWGDWPWTVERLDDLARAACVAGPTPSVPAVSLPRNLLVLGIAVGHILRRWFTW